MPEENEPLLTAVIDVLRTPVDLGPELEARVMAIVTAAPAPRAPRRWLPAGAAWAAALAGVALLGTLVARQRQPASVAAESTRLVELSLQTTAGERVAAVGDFNNWDPRATVLTRRGGRWTTTLRLRPGRYRYTFLVDDARWVADPRGAPAADPDFDRPTSLLTVSH